MSTAQIARLGARRNFRFELSDRAAMLWCLSSPLLLALVAFATAVATTAHGAPQIGTLRSAIAAAAYVYLALGAVGIPAYAVGYVWFWWITRQDGSLLVKRLLTMPVVTAAFIWLPSLVVAPVSIAVRLKMFLLFAIAALIVGYLWAGLVRFVFYAWRRI